MSGFGSGAPARGPETWEATPDFANSAHARHGHVYLLVGPSGGGKTSLIRRVVGDGSSAFCFIPSTTSRPPRPGEMDGIDYYFANDATFDRLIADGDFLEWQRVHGYRYGSSRRRLESVVIEGRRGITSADILGAFKIKAAMPADVTTVFVTPSSLDDLRQRILARAPLSSAEFERRLGRVQMEMRLAHACDRLILNDDLDTAATDLRLIMAAERNAATRLRHFGLSPVVPMVEMELPPSARYGDRFCVADCETPSAAVDRILHQWWWECHPGAMHFDLPARQIRPTGRREYVRIPGALLDVTWWSATLPNGQPFAQALR